MSHTRLSPRLGVVHPAKEAFWWRWVRVIGVDTAKRPRPGIKHLIPFAANCESQNLEGFEVHLKGVGNVSLLPNATKRTQTGRRQAA